ncbi:tetratricopeptide repeat protein [Methanocalculus sp.]|uniref:tetratricopeptide repeat protein n=1 Tax=Methanocalculus sp. TaxID=2004547 RepID=UPI002604C66B|nr:tetratricopeptide repeat protein [Methanocalculus sp.]MDG6249438.1 tetratricopeptide repeat protein [Methanocalculus sp.]
MAGQKKTDSHSKYVHHYRLGTTQYKASRFLEAIKSFDNALKYKPQSYWAWNEKGNALRKLGRLEEALKCYNHATSLDRSKSYPFAYIGRGDVHREQKTYKKAISNYNQALKIKRHPFALNGKAQCFYETGNKNEAFQLAEEAILLRPYFEHPYILTGDILFDRGLYKDAKERYERAIGLIDTGSSELRAALHKKIQDCSMKIDAESPGIKDEPDIDPEDIGALLSQLRSGNDSGRAEASYNLDICAKKNLAGQIIRHRPFPLFESALGDPVPEVRKQVQWILGNLALHGFSYEVTESGVLGLLAANLGDTNEEVRSAAAWTLAVIAEVGQGIRVAETGMIHSCIQLLDDSNAGVRSSAALALDKVAFYASPEPIVHADGVVNLAGHILDTDTGVRASTLWALWSIAFRGYVDSICDAPDLITDLKQSAQSRNLEIRKAAISLIGELSTVSDKSFLENKDLERILISGIGSRSNRVRGASIWAVGRWADAGIATSLIRSGVKEAMRNCRDDHTNVHVFYHSELRWKQRSIGGIADDVLKKLDEPTAAPDDLAPCEADYRTAYFVVNSYVEHLAQSELHEARKKVVHLEQFVCGPTLEVVRYQRDHLDLYIQQEIDEIPEEFVNEAELLKEEILRRALA